MTEYPVAVQVVPVTEQRNRLTAAFRFFLALPHLLLVGGPAAVGIGTYWRWEGGLSFGSSGGIFGMLVAVTTLIMWIAIVITARHVNGLWGLAAFYMRWRVRALAYLMLLRDDYPPFGDDDEYPASLRIDEPQERDRLTVFFRLLLALPHLLLLGLIGVLWSFTTALAWVLILVTGRYPETLYGFALGALAWTTRVEAYVLLLRDEYPPFSLRA
jgi:hypothetical protein